MIVLASALIACAPSTNVLLFRVGAVDMVACLLQGNRIHLLREERIDAALLKVDNSVWRLASRPTLGADELLNVVAGVNKERPGQVDSDSFEIGGKIAVSAVFEFEKDDYSICLWKRAAGGQTYSLREVFGWSNKLRFNPATEYIRAGLIHGKDIAYVNCLEPETSEWRSCVVDLSGSVLGRYRGHVIGWISSEPILRNRDGSITHARRSVAKMESNTFHWSLVSNDASYVRLSETEIYRLRSDGKGGVSVSKIRVDKDFPDAHPSGFTILMSQVEFLDL